MTHPPYPQNVGVLLTNLGTPDAPTPSAVRRYLAEFLWDPRVVEIPHPLWWLILHGVILRFRPAKSAKLYQQIWTAEGSPLRIILEKQAAALRNELGDRIKIVTAMRYGKPSIVEAMESLKKQQVQKILLFPLYPQYSASTTASTFDEVARVLKTWRWQPELRTINGYHDNDAYINAITHSIQYYWQNHQKPQKLLFSFHGLPKQFLIKGDPYYCFCQKTARLVAEKLQLSKDDYATSFQSRLGVAEWLQPYTDKTLATWGKQGVESVNVICPGFSADCLESLEEIQQFNQKIFKQAGGKDFHYIPALNDSMEHIQLLAKLIRAHTQGWKHD
jgi:protoporphyrin/coproporphyrin ferrochelatase